MRLLHARHKISKRDENVRSSHAAHKATQKVGNHFISFDLLPDESQGQNCNNMQSSRPSTSRSVHMHCTEPSLPVFEHILLGFSPPDLNRLIFSLIPVQSVARAWVSLQALDPTKDKMHKQLPWWFSRIYSAGPFRIIRTSVIRLVHGPTFFQNRFGLSFWR